MIINLFIIKLSSFYNQPLIGQKDRARIIIWKSVSGFTVFVAVNFLFIKKFIPGKDPAFSIASKACLIEIAIVTNERYKTILWNTSIQQALCFSYAGK